MSPKPILGYWDIRGRGEPIRLLLTYAGVDFEDKRYSFGHGSPAERAKSEWFQVKQTLGFDFPNLPYLIDGDVKLTQTLAILRYLARKHKLEGTNEQEKNRIAVLEQQVLDISTAYIRFVHKKEPTDEEKAAFVKELESNLELVSKFLGTNKFASGGALSYVDFWLYEYLHWVDTNETAAGVLAKFDNLKQYVARFEALPQLSAYLAKVNAKK